MLIVIMVYFLQLFCALWVQGKLHVVAPNLPASSDTSDGVRSSEMEEGGEGDEEEDEGDGEGPAGKGEEAEDGADADAEISEASHQDVQQDAQQDAQEKGPRETAFGADSGGRGGSQLDGFTGEESQLPGETMG